MTEKFVQTVSSVNYNKGVFSLYFVGQDQTKMSNGVMAENDNDLELTYSYICTEQLSIPTDDTLNHKAGAFYGCVLEW